LLEGLREGLDKITGVIDAVGRHKAGTLTVATDFGFAAFWFVPRLPSLRHAVPDLDVRVVTSQTEIDLQREPIDVAIIFGSGDWPGCIAEPIIQESVLPVCAPSLLVDRPAPATPIELQAFPLLHLESNENNKWQDWPGWFRAVGASSPTFEPQVTINNYSLVIQAALAGQGVALGWRPLVDDLLERGQLIPVLD
jgi:DNA-binding transcriptional LysR family regulator